MIYPFAFGNLPVDGVALEDSERSTKHTHCVGRGAIHNCSPPFKVITQVP